MLLILLVNCVVLSLGVYVAHLVCYLCCGFFWGVYVAHLVSYLCWFYFGGSMLLILLVISACFLGGFLCCSSC